MPSSTPLHLSWCMTRLASMTPGRFSSLGMMQRTKWGMVFRRVVMRLFRDCLWSCEGVRCVYVWRLDYHISIKWTTTSVLINKYTINMLYIIGQHHMHEKAIIIQSIDLTLPPLPVPWWWRRLPSSLVAALPPEDSRPRVPQQRDLWTSWAALPQSRWGDPCSCSTSPQLCTPPGDRGNIV